MRSVLEAFEEIEREYESDPEGWQVLTGEDEKSSNHKIYFFHRDECWVMMHPSYGLNGYGEKFKVENNEELEERLENPLSFGLRPVSERLMKMVMRGYREKFEEELEEIDTCASKDVEEKENVDAFVGGPLIHSDRPLGEIVSGQGSLEEKMRREIERLTGSMYR